MKFGTITHVEEWHVMGQISHASQRTQKIRTSSRAHLV